MTKGQAQAFCGEFSSPSKMPGRAYGLPAGECCPTGSKLMHLESSPCSDCYAQKGRCGMVGALLAQARRLRAVTLALSSPAARAEFIAAFSRGLVGEKYFRFHDTGDIQSVDHARLLCEIAAANPSVRFWTPTLESRVVESLESIPPNMTFRISSVRYDTVRKGSFPTSYVVDKGSVKPGTYECPSRYQGNSCGDCRACWNPKVMVVAYHKH